MTSLSAALFPVIAAICLGGLLGRTTDLFKGPALSGLVSTVGIPALLLHSILAINMDLSLMADLIVITLLYVVLMTGATIVMLRFCPGVTRIRSYLPALVNPNTGNMGVPVCFALFGQESVALALVISSVIQVSHFTLGVGCLSGDYTVKALCRNGPVLALICGALLLAADVSVPVPVLNTLDMLGAITVPVMLMQLGSSVFNLKAEGARHILRPLLLSIWRPLAGLFIAWLALIIWPFSPPLSDLQAKVFLVQGAMPVAVLSYVLAVKYGAGQEDSPQQDIAIMILSSLIFSLVLVAVAHTLGVF
ncbi:MAG: transporter [Oleibacter sp.]|nr:transporter [Thalassolituus sp.]|tara:strand:- start:1014 stop:1931 length:918 start_codon:yes stop_codon:yes gene_type:complete